MDLGDCPVNLSNLLKRCSVSSNFLWANSSSYLLDFQRSVMVSPSDTVFCLSVCRFDIPLNLFPLLLYAMNAPNNMFSHTYRIILHSVKCQLLQPISWWVILSAVRDEIGLFHPFTYAVLVKDCSCCRQECAITHIALTFRISVFSEFFCSAIRAFPGNIWIYHFCFFAIFDMTFCVSYIRFSWVPVISVSSGVRDL